MLEQDFESDKDEDYTAGDFGFGFIFESEDITHL